jgi:hypothetical protein
MRRTSPKRQQRITEAAPWRTELRAQGFCDWCSSDRNGLEIHEVSGGSTRGLELDKPFSTNLLCAACHRDLEALPKNHAVCIGLALIRYRRPESYNLEHYYRLTARRWPDESLVEIWWTRLLLGQTTTTTYAREFP